MYLVALASNAQFEKLRRTTSVNLGHNGLVRVHPKHGDGLYIIGQGAESAMETDRSSCCNNPQEVSTLLAEDEIVHQCVEEIPTMTTKSNQKMEWLIEDHLRRPK
jgi:hypothetical protein